MVKKGFARTLYSIAATGALVLAFMAVTSRTMRAQHLPQPAPFSETLSGAFNKEAGHSYWKHPDYDSIIDFWIDAKGPQMRVHAINPDNPRVKDMIAKGAKKDVSQLTQEDFDKAASYVSILKDMKQEKDGSWRGKLFVASRNEHFGVHIRPSAEGQPNLLVRGYIIEGWKKWVTLGNPGNVVGLTLSFTPVENPPPRGYYRSLPPTASDTSTRFADTTKPDTLALKNP